MNAGKRHFNGTVRCVPERLEIPLHWRKPRRVFVNSMSDVFHPSVPDEFIDLVFAVMSLAHQHQFQILTKRPERMYEYINSRPADTPKPGRAVILTELGRSPHPDIGDIHYSVPWPLPNVWLGTSCEDQSTFNQRASWLAKTPAAVRFFSMEPLLGPIRWSDQTVSVPWAGGEARGGRDYSMLSDFIDWVIVGGESGADARPCYPEWIRTIVAQCREAGVAVFVKQLGGYAILDPRYDRTLSGWTRKLRDRKGGDPAEWPEDLRVREYPQAAA